MGSKTLTDRIGKGSNALGAVNSINWARILAQMVYHVWAFLQLPVAVQDAAVQGKRRVRVVVPTGNFGNILAAFYARSAGLAISELVAATNANDVVHRALETGIYEPHPVKATYSPAMDITLSSNFERLVFEAARACAQGDVGMAQTRVNAYWQELGKTGRFVLDPHHAAWIRDTCGFRSNEASDEETVNVMQRLWQEQKYLVDPHTAVGIAVLDKMEQGDNDVTVYCSTAHPAKFDAAVRAALGDDEARRIPWPESIRALQHLPQKLDLIERHAQESWTSLVREKMDREQCE